VGAPSFISDNASLTARVGDPPYACAKAGLNALTWDCEDLAPWWRVNRHPGLRRSAPTYRGAGAARGAEVPFVPWEEGRSGRGWRRADALDRAASELHHGRSSASDEGAARFWTGR